MEVQSKAVARMLDVNSRVPDTFQLGAISEFSAMRTGRSGSASFQRAKQSLSAVGVPSIVEFYGSSAASA